MDDYCDKVVRLFYEQYEPHKFEKISDYIVDNKHIVVFQHRSMWSRHRPPVHVYLHEKGFLMPFFPTRDKNEQ